MNMNYARRLAQLEAMSAPAELIPVGYLIDALPPLSAAASVRFTAWLERAPGVADDPDAVFRAQDMSDLDRAERVLREVPSDMAVTAAACAGLLVHAWLLWETDRFGTDYAWRHLRNCQTFERQLAPRFEATL